jgi:hypothetical protein
VQYLRMVQRRNTLSYKQTFKDLLPKMATDWPNAGWLLAVNSDDVKGQVIEKTLDWSTMYVYTLPQTLLFDVLVP